MNLPFDTKSRLIFRIPVAAIGLLAVALAVVPGAYSKGEKRPSRLPRITAFQAGETLSYKVSWSKFLTAGHAVMEVKQEKTPKGREVFRFIVTSQSVGVVGTLYPLGDIVESVFDPRSMQSLSFSLKRTQGSKKRSRELVFNPTKKTVVSRLNEDPPETIAVPARVLDSLSALYYLRTIPEFVEDKPVTMDVFYSKKSTPVEVETLGREKITTPAGEFDTIKVRAHKGLFMSEGDIEIWLTDDSRKIPVRIKSTIKIGSIVFNLQEMQ